MGNSNLLRWVYLAFFALFAGASCWATAESFHLLMPGWPIVLVYGVTIGLFLLASMGTKWMVDSLNTNIILDNRKTHLFGGLFVVLATWLFCSMPTNTHTFFYRTVIGEVVLQDVNVTEGYLAQLTDNVKLENQIKAAETRIDREIETQLLALNAEIDNINNPGFGPRSKEILARLAQILQVKSLEELSYRGTSEAERATLKKTYRDLVITQRDQVKAKLRETMTNKQEQQFKAAAQKDLKALTAIKDRLIEMNQQGAIDESSVTRANVALTKAYGTVHNYASFVDFSSPEDRALYTAPKFVTRTSRMLSVIDVWKDYFSGEYDGRGFIFWILLSVVIDIAAFIFFDLAFKQEEY